MGVQWPANLVKEIVFGRASRGGVTLCPPPLMSLITFPNAGSYRSKGFFLSLNGGCVIVMLHGNIFFAAKFVAIYCYTVAH